MLNDLGTSIMGDWPPI